MNLPSSAVSPLRRAAAVAGNQVISRRAAQQWGADMAKCSTSVGFPCARRVRDRSDQTLTWFPIYIIHPCPLPSGRCTEIIIFMSMRYTFSVLCKLSLCCMYPALTEQRPTVGFTPPKKMVWKGSKPAATASSFDVAAIDFCSSVPADPQLIRSLSLLPGLACEHVSESSPVCGGKSCVAYCSRQECVQKIILMD